MQGICVERLSAEDRYLLEAQVDFFIIDSWKKQKLAEPEVVVAPPSNVRWLGWAGWYQNAYAQTDSEQDTTMNKAAVSWAMGKKIPGVNLHSVRAATHRELEEGLIDGLPSLVGLGFYLMFTGNDCAGTPDGSCKSGHQRKCVNIPNRGQWLGPISYERDACRGRRMCCVVEARPPTTTVAPVKAILP
eukprot:TRINITY_DN67216_c3_g2_i1.p1 TRINITY_DN67216_c3_g2~~TRINITY_DN67216_c3_g2_i1.p1  ORF type:complete len:188 (-),score=14.85 TRINITY_DN67216_c3_g2_i1:210-773(-)